MVLHFKALFKTNKQWQQKQKEYGTETVCAPQSLKYLLSGLSQKKIADPALQDSLLLTLVWKYQKNLAFF